MGKSQKAASKSLAGRGKGPMGSEKGSLVSGKESERSGGNLVGSGK